MEAYIQLFSDSEAEIRISEPDEDNQISIDIREPKGDSYTSIYITLPMLQKLRSWLYQQETTMEKNEKAQIQTKENG